MLKHFSDITKDYLLSEMHIHSQWTDGQASLIDITKHASQLGLKRLFFTDHIRKSSTYFDRYFAETQEISAKSKLDIKVGFESKVSDYEGNLDIPEGARKKADIIIGTVHSIPRNNDFVHPSLLNEGELEKAEYELSLAMISAKSADILGHAGGMSIALFGKFNLKYLEELIAKCADNDIAFEINSRYHATITNWMFDRLSKYNPLIAIGSDVHGINEVGVCSEILREKLRCNAVMQ